MCIRDSPGPDYFYKVVAVDRRGNVSEPVTVKATTRPLKVVTRRLRAVDGRLTAGLKKGRSIDVDYVAFPQGAPAEDQKLSLTFDVPAAGDYYLWCEYSPRHTKGRWLRFDLDGREFGRWATHQPWRLRRNRPIKPGTERWFVQRVVAGKGRYARNPTDRVHLDAGKHVLEVVFDGTNAGRTPWVSTFWVTNDASFVPKGYSPQFRFNRLRRQR